MQFKTITLATFVGLAAAASSSSVSSLVSQIPSCASTCLDQGAAAASCGTTDYSCQCDNQDTITANASTCLVSSCSVSDIASTKSVVSELCDAVDGTNSTTSTSTTSNSTTTGTSSSSSASSTSTKGSSSAGARVELYNGLGWAVIAGLAGLIAL